MVKKTETEKELVICAMIPAKKRRAAIPLGIREKEMENTI
jgi:hypothetical protein